MKNLTSEQKDYINKKGVKVVLHQDTKCAICGKIINKKTLCYWVSSNSLNPVGAGVIHEDCFEEIVHDKPSRILPKKLKWENDSWDKDGITLTSSITFGKSTQPVTFGKSTRGNIMLSICQVPYKMEYGYVLMTFRGHNKGMKITGTESVFIKHNITLKHAKKIARRLAEKAERLLTKEI